MAGAGFKNRFSSQLARLLTTPPLTNVRIGFAFAVAVAADSLQILLGPLGWFLMDQILDVIAMVLTTAALGFHPLLLPTFVLEMLPVSDWLPTWTGCVGAVVMLRKARQPASSALPPKIAEATRPPPRVSSGTGDPGEVLDTR